MDKEGQGRMEWTVKQPLSLSLFSNGPPGSTALGWGFSETEDPLMLQHRRLHFRLWSLLHLGVDSTEIQTVYRKIVLVTTYCSSRSWEYNTLDFRFCLSLNSSGQKFEREGPKIVHFVKQRLGSIGKEGFHFFVHFCYLTTSFPSRKANILWEHRVWYNEEKGPGKLNFTPFEQASFFRKVCGLSYP